MNIFYELALSMHLGLEGDYQPFHPNVGIEYNNFITGAYYNSESAISPYIGYRYELNDKTSVEFGLVGGYTTNPIEPMLKLNYDLFFVAPAREIYNDERLGLVVGIEQRF